MEEFAVEMAVGLVVGVVGAAALLWLMRHSRLPHRGLYPLRVLAVAGAIYGIMGALLVLEYRATGSFAGPALGLIVLNLALTFAIPNISIGGHLGGLAGGILATFALSHFRDARGGRSLGPALVALIAVASFVVAYVRVESYV